MEFGSAVEVFDMSFIAVCLYLRVSTAMCALKLANRVGHELAANLLVPYSYSADCKSFDLSSDHIAPQDGVYCLSALQPSGGL